MKKLLLPILLSVFGLTGCEFPEEYETSEKQVRELIFGHAYGFCAGEECVETFKVNYGGLYEDSVDDYSHKSFDFSRLPNETFRKTSEILFQIPLELWDMEDGRIGCPDCADGGGVYVQYEKNGVSKSWFIDNQLANVPTVLHPFVKNIHEAVAKINGTNADDDINNEPPFVVVYPNTLTNVTELTFGSFYGRCIGDDCVKTFKINQEQVFVDSIQDYSHNTFDFHPMSEDAFYEAKPLLTSIPNELWEQPQGNIGCPDCADGGGLYIQVTRGDEVKTWLVDYQNVPEFLTEFVDSANKKIKVLVNADS